MSITGRIAGRLRRARLERRPTACLKGMLAKPCGTVVL